LAPALLFGQLFLNHFDKFWGSDYNYNSIIVDLRKYFPVGMEKVLAFQVYSLNTTGYEVPIRSLASFGGSNRMRGYYDGRYKDNNMFILQTEYRFPIYHWLKGVVFGGSGTVSHDIKAFEIQNVKSSFGGGLRIALSKKEKLNLRIDYGIGQGKNNGLYLQLGEAF
jgi:hemolysin activation/secretion protein